MCSVCVNNSFIPSNVNCNFLGTVPLIRYYEMNAKSCARVFVLLLRLISFLRQVTVTIQNNGKNLNAKT